MTGSLAILTDCADLSAFRIRGRSGKPVNPPDPQTTEIQVKLVALAGKWVVQDYDELPTRGCEPTAVS